MESGFKPREGETVLLEEEIELVYEEKKSCLQKLLSCCSKTNKQGSTFIIITNQRLLQITKQTSSKRSSYAGTSDYTFIPPHAIIEYGYHFGEANKKSFLCCCCCGKELSASGGSFYFKTANATFALRTDSVEQLEQVSEALYKLINKA